MDRRNFLAALAAAGIQGTLGGSLLRSAKAAHDPAHSAPGCGVWGDLDGSVGGVGPWDCGNHQGFKILDIYLYAGASPWETFWLPGNLAAPLFSSHGMGGLPLNLMDWAANVNVPPAADNPPCIDPDIPPAFDEAAFFAEQSGGGHIHWGAPARPLYLRNDIMSRCRMVTQYHELPPHEAAIPYCLTGLKLGNPRLAGTGAAIQRRARALFPDQLLPASYVLHRGGSLAINPVAATGMHPGFARPLVIQVSSGNSFFDNLGRAGMTSESDELLLSLRHEHRDRLRFRGAGDIVRSAGFDGYWVAAELLKDAPTLQALFAGDLLVVDSNVAVCPEHPGASVGNNPGAKTMLHAAASLLSSGPARYVSVIDRGRAGSYDTHGDGSQLHLLRTSANLYNVLYHLADIIHDPIANPTGTLNLDDTMVVINTEFGRTNYINGNNGRDHWPWGNVATLIGGPITGGATIRGAIESSGADEGKTVAAHRYNPADIRAAMMLAAGINPFAEGNFRVSDFLDSPVGIGLGADQEGDIVNRLREWILGLA